MNNFTASDMTGHTALLFAIVVFFVLCAIGVLSDLLNTRKHDRRQKALANELKRRARVAR